MSRTARRSLATSLLISQVAVSVAMALTMVVVAVIAGPALFAAHMRQAGESNPEVLAHSQEAFTTAGGLALLIGLLIAASGAVLVSWLVSRRLRRSLDELAAAVARVAEGDYRQRVAEANYFELAAVGESFNAMAGRLDSIEGSRRQLLTDLAHEVRTPLASMEICVESLEDGVLEPGPEAWRILNDQIARIARLADDLGQVSAAEEGRLGLDLILVEAGQLGLAAIRAAQEAFDREQVRLDFRPSAGVLWVRADRNRIGQVLGNLLSNALRHTPAGGVVVVQVSAEGNQVGWQVVDTGDGISAEHLPHVFERFYRADPARDRDSGGTGVGLAISKAIALAHGGRLLAASPGMGQGASFTLWLPKAAPPGA